MLYTRNGWQEIVSDDGKYKTYMAIFMPRDEFAWEEIVATLPKINSAVEGSALARHAHITYSAEVLTISFQYGEGEELPEQARQTAEELSALLTE